MPWEKRIHSVSYSITTCWILCFVLLTQTENLILIHLLLHIFIRFTITHSQIFWFWTVRGLFVLDIWFVWDQKVDVIFITTRIVIQKVRSHSKIILCQTSNLKTIHIIWLIDWLIVWLFDVIWFGLVCRVASCVVHQLVDDEVGTENCWETSQCGEELPWMEENSQSRLETLARNDDWWIMNEL